MKIFTKNDKPHLFLHTLIGYFLQNPNLYPGNRVIFILGQNETIERNVQEISQNSDFSDYEADQNESIFASKLQELEDYSVEVSNLTETEILKELEIPKSSQRSLKALQTYYQIRLKKYHPIRKYLNNLPQAKLKLLQKIVCPNSSNLNNRDYQRMPGEIARVFFKNYPQNPLTSLKNFMENEFEWAEKLQNAANVKQNEVVESNTSTPIKQQSQIGVRNEISGQEVKENNDKVAMVSGFLSKVDESIQDYSVDISNMTRSDLKRKLDLPNSSKCTQKLQSSFKKSLKDAHPIMDYLKRLSKSEIKLLHKKVCPTLNHYRFERLPLEVAKVFFENHPKTPLTSLKSFIRQEWGESFERKSENVIENKSFEKEDPLALGFKGKFQVDENDCSVDVSHLSRQEILGSKALNSQGNNSRRKTEDLRKVLERKIKISHPIHKYLTDLSTDHVKLAYCKIIEMNIGLREGAKYERCPTFERMRFKIAKTFFQVYPKSPLTSLRRFVGSGCVDVFQIPENTIDEDDNFDELSPEFKEESDYVSSDFPVINDPSVYVENLSRTELLSRLPSISSNHSNARQATKILQRKVRNEISKSHPIHEFLDSLPHAKIKLIYSKILEMKRNTREDGSNYRNAQTFTRMKKQIAKAFFQIYPQHPLTSLQKFIENGCVDTLEILQEPFDDEEDINTIEAQEDSTEEKETFEFDSETFSTQNDPSVDVSNWSRLEILSRLPPNSENDKESTKSLQQKMRLLLSKSHPIHKFLTKMSILQIIFVHSRVVANGTENSGNYPRLRKDIAKSFFENYPNSPMSCLRHFLIQNKNEINLQCSDASFNKAENSASFLNQKMDQDSDSFDSLQQYGEKSGYMKQSESVENSSQIESVENNTNQLEPLESYYDDEDIQNYTDEAETLENYSDHYEGLENGANYELSQDDFSVDVSNMTRSELMAQLQLPKSKLTTLRLRQMVKASLSLIHPIHSFLKSLPKPQLKYIHSRIFNKRRTSYERILKEIAKSFFQMYPGSPLTSLKYFIDQGCPEMPKLTLKNEEYPENYDEFGQDSGFVDNESIEVKEEVLDDNEVTDIETNHNFDQDPSLSTEISSELCPEKDLNTDNSIDVTKLTRQEVLHKLELSSSRQSTKNLQSALRNYLKTSHPLLTYLQKLPDQKIEFLHKKLCSQSSKPNISRMHKEIAKNFFVNHPMNPFTAMKIILAKESQFMNEKAKPELGQSNDFNRTDSVSVKEEVFDHTAMTGNINTIDPGVSGESSLRDCDQSNELEFDKQNDIETTAEVYDYSVDVTNLTRHEILAKLQLSSSRNSYRCLQRTLRLHLRRYHPILPFLGNLSKPKIKFLHKRFCSKSKSRSRMPKEVAKYFFENHAKTPLTSLKNILDKEYRKFEFETPLIDCKEEDTTLNLGDPSVDFSSWSRQQCLQRLRLKSSNSATFQLKRTLRRSACVSHPLHKFLNDMPQEDLKLAYSKIVEMKVMLGSEALFNKMPTFLRMRQQVAKAFFNVYPQNPLTSLKKFYANGFVDALEVPQNTFDEVDYLENPEMQEFDSELMGNDTLIQEDPLDSKEGFEEHRYDPSLEVSCLSRQELLTNLDLKNSKSTTSILQRKYRRKIKISHPIHKFLDGVPHADIKLAYSKIMEMNIGLRDGAKYSRNPTLPRMKIQIAKTFFLVYPQSPLTYVKQFFANGCSDVLEVPLNTINETDELQQELKEDLQFESNDFPLHLMEEDPSIVVEHMTRTELLDILQIPNPRTTIKKLHRKLKSLIKQSHPIHKFLDELPKPLLNLVQSKVVELKRSAYEDYNYTKGMQEKSRMKQSIANMFFLIYPQCPLTSLKQFIDNGCVDKLEMPEEPFEDEDENFDSFEAQADSLDENDTFEIPKQEKFEDPQSTYSRFEMCQLPVESEIQIENLSEIKQEVFDDFM